MATWNIVLHAVHASACVSERCGAREKSRGLLAGSGAVDEESSSSDDDQQQEEELPIANLLVLSRTGRCII